MCLAVLRRFGALLDAAAAGEPIRDRWRARLNTLGQELTLRAGDTVVRGRAADVTDEGSLVIERPDGSRTAFAAGEVTTRL
jgi:BirA family biotin operon repressor/biotin-[acetyl-CoA-carboxylase] ligase